MIRSSPALLALVALLAYPSLATAQAGVVKGIVTDTLDQPLANAEVTSIGAKKSTRTDKDGRFALARLAFGQHLLVARLAGYRSAERAITMLDSATPELTFKLQRSSPALDSVRIASHDGCAAYDFRGFECRRRVGIGQFRNADELLALRPEFFADLFDGLPGLRRESVRNAPIGQEWHMVSTTGWRCLMEGWNGRLKTAAEDRIRPDQIVALEYYETNDKVPAAYKRLAWPSGQDKPCALAMYWTRGFIENEGRRP